MTNVAKAIDATAQVADATTRDLRFPLATRTQNQRVFRLDTKKTERWTGSAWVVDPIDYADIANAPSVDAAWGNNSLTTTGLTYGYNAGTAIVAGVPTLIAAGTTALSDNNTNFVERTYAGVVTASIAGFTAGSIPMAQVVTLAGAVTTITDYRSPASPVTPYPLVTGESGVTSTLYEQGHVSRYGAALDGTTADDTPFANAVTQAGAIKGRVRIPLGTGALKLANNATVPATVHLTFEQGGQITIAAGKTLTIAGPIDAPPRQIFAGSGTVVFSAMPTSAIRPEWWGAKIDGTTDDASAWNAAALALSPVGGRVTIPDGTSVIGTPLNAYTGVEHVGSGNTSVIRVKSGLGGGITMLKPASTGVTGGAIRNCVLDQRTDLYPSTGHEQCVSVDKTIGFTIENVEFRNHATMAVWCDSPTANPTKKLSVLNCRFLGYAGTAGTADGTNGGISLFGAFWDTRILGNHFENHRDDCVAIQDSVNGRPVRVTITGNTFLNNQRRFNGSTPHGVLVYGALNATVTGNVIDTTCAAAIWAGSGAFNALKDCAITGNTILNAGVTADSVAGVPIAGIYVLGLRSGTGYAEGITITGNTIRGAQGNGVFLQDVIGFTMGDNVVKSSLNNGVSLTYCTDGTITGNTILDNGTSASGLELNGIILFATSPTVTCDNIVITGNRIGDTRAGGSKTQTYAVYLSGGANLQYLQFHGNNVRGNLTGVIGGAPPVTLDVRENTGYNPVGIAAQGLGASPWTYTNQSLCPMTVYIWGGTVSNISIGGQQIASQSNTSFSLEPNEAFTMTYSSAPQMRVQTH
jgi:parallel beta-helix repeat protein